MPETQVVDVRVSPSRGGCTGAILFVLGLVLFAGAFVAGIGTGIVSALAASMSSQFVLEEPIKGGKGGLIAVLPVEGAIGDRSSQFIEHATRHLLDRGDIKAVVLRVDSPGGAVAPSDRINRDVGRLKAAGIPVVASYGGVAASGGYYVSCGSDWILAEPTCITGSIGVIAQIFTFEGLLSKVGVQPVTLVASGSPRKDTANDLWRAWTPEDREVVVGILDAAYGTFRDRVAAGRGSHIPAAEMDSVCDGEVYTAPEALQLGLIDGIGYLEDAIAEAERRAGIAPGTASVMRVAPPPSLPFGLGDAKAGLDDPAALRDAATELSRPRILFLAPISQ